MLSWLQTHLGMAVARFARVTHAGFWAGLLTSHFVQGMAKTAAESWWQSHRDQAIWISLTGVITAGAKLLRQKWPGYFNWLPL